MSNNHSACTGKSISYENLKSLCPQEVQAIEENEFFNDELDWGLLAKGIQQCDSDIAELLPLVKNLQDAFEKATSISTETGNSYLELELEWYNDDNKEETDEVDDHEGCIFRVDNIYALTPAGQKFMHLLSDLSYVDFS